MTLDVPVFYSTQIKKEWLDYNNHMNVAYYVLVFDHAGEALVESLGLGEAVTADTGISWMVLENHITYDDEVSLGQEVDIRIQVVDYDQKRLHLYYEMHVPGPEGYLASTLEQMMMCVELDERRSAIFPEAVVKKIQALSEQQSHLERPENIGRKIGLRK
jgi:acyl-CoA thioester hydrolase